jgi:glycosyltransferase involved in cell wall biosynthesis
MRILWLSNAILSNDDVRDTGSWLGPLAARLVASGEMELGNISEGEISGTGRRDCGAIAQWVVPKTSVSLRSGLPPRRVVAQLVDAIHQFEPDLVHVWGVENYWGLLTGRKFVRQSALLEMQGLRGAYARVYKGGLSRREERHCIGFRELVKRATISQDQRRFEAWEVFENEMILAHRYIATQSDWMEAQIRSVHPDCCTSHSDLVLRPAFTASEPWAGLGSKTLFTVSAYPVPYKGIHVALRALAILKKRFPDIGLRIAGPVPGSGVRRNGYAHWLGTLASALGIGDKVRWLGPLSSEEIAGELRTCGAMIVPSYIENCSTAMQEGMMVGAPVVASYVGGLPSIGKDEESALFFPAGDHVACAWQVARILSDPELAGRLSRNARDLAAVRNDTDRIVKRQLAIYGKIIAEDTEWKAS